MKLNMNCIRDVLFAIEKLPVGEEIELEKMPSLLPNYRPDDVLYSCKKLQEAGYLQINEIYCRKPAKYISDITWEGHQFLSNIRHDTVWKKTMTIAGKFGSYSVEMLSKIAVGVLTDLIKREL